MKSLTNKLTNLFFYLSILFFIIGFNFRDAMVGNWYQQFMPNIGSRSIQDVFFLDSLNGWSVTNATNQNPDTIFVLKTTNSGDNWAIQYRKVQTGGGFSGYFKVYFINQNTGYVCDVKGIDKTTNGGINWLSLNAPLTAYTDMSILNTDTIWIVTPDNFAGGVFRTTNGGMNWQQQYSNTGSNPSHIYMYNARIGFQDGGNLQKTTNSGVSWFSITGEGQFFDMHFVDSLTGWKSGGGFKFTSNGGVNWITQSFPQGSGWLATGIGKFSTVNRDTLWGVGGIRTTGSGSRGVIYKTTNMGNNWNYQLPDTININIFQYAYNKFVNKLNGWAYSPITGVHTVTGGDTITYTSINQTSSSIPDKFFLGQNYPNPFNINSKIKFQISKLSNIKLKVFDITGREVRMLVNQKLNAGTYETDFDGSSYSSGIYFYSLIVDGKLIDTKKMVLLK